MDEATLDNILIHQKDYIIFLINQERLIEARSALACVAKLWNACDYTYKIEEMNNRITQAEFPPKL